MAFRQCLQLPYQVSLIISKCLLQLPPAPPLSAVPWHCQCPQELNSCCVWGKHFRVIDTTTRMGTNSSSLFIDTASFEVCFCSQHGKISRSLLALAAGWLPPPAQHCSHLFPNSWAGSCFVPLPQHLHLPPGPRHSFNPSFLNFFVRFPSLPVYLLPSSGLALHCWANSPPQLSLPAPTVTYNCLRRFWCCPFLQGSTHRAASGT